VKGGFERLKVAVMFCRHLKFYEAAADSECECAVLLDGTQS